MHNQWNKIYLLQIKCKNFLSVSLPQLSSKLVSQLIFPPETSVFFVFYTTTDTRGKISSFKHREILISSFVRALLLWPLQSSYSSFSWTLVVLLRQGLRFVTAYTIVSQSGLSFHLDISLLKRLHCCMELTCVTSRIWTKDVMKHDIHHFVCTFTNRHGSVV